jgi:hypothetical protein
MKRTCSLLILLATMLGGTAVGQPIPVLVPGQRIRVTAPAFGLPGVPARLVALSRDTLEVTGIGASWQSGPVHGDTTHYAVPLRDLKRLDLSAGVERHGKLGAAIGALVGGAIGALAGLSSRDQTGALCDWLIPCVSRGGQTAIYALEGASLGGLVGWVVGNFIVTEAWDRVPLEMLVSLGPAAGGRVGLGVALRLGSR